MGVMDAGLRAVGAGLLAAGLMAASAQAQAPREVAPLAQYGVHMHPDDVTPADGPEGTQGKAIPVPSGQKVWWIDVIHSAQGANGLTYRFRFLAPQIGGPSPLSPEIALADIESLCNSWVAARLAKPAPGPVDVVVSLSDRIVPFGEVDHEATQYFDTYSVDKGKCEWQFF
ncbi:hypothetical protein DL1_13475 [Thioclava dalianensis]|uniref:Acetolactate synthase n=1 Tax=Thioclava dalianensis TaxID=1185766 RepID=A0A074TPC4_9RHOB|nr:DUF6497 family protein [Thioclava dalianensis]KEP70823.1 hypothetical protein DL1_13475 [Thioclava dalianensis]SFN11802.1 hypothetical protein SAMN05216224_102487 [Thioclava dalianensis]